ncbi:MAG: hypothetical protein HY815_33195 [Candidatus Riflebacteria bacterium]|nr:hypothetical protein [Candidatus Riflebacteria bacterium]
MDDARFKQCPLCRSWLSLGDILRSPEVVPTGMTFVGPGNDRKLVYFFSHRRPECDTTFHIPVAEFLTEITEPVPLACLAGTPTCQRRCIRREDLELCGESCSSAPFRRFLVNVLLKRCGRQR